MQPTWKTSFGSLFANDPIFRRVALPLAVVAAVAAPRVLQAQTGQPAQADIAASAATSAITIADELLKDPGIVVADVNGSPISRGEVADQVRELSPVQANVPAQELFHAVLQQMMRQRAVVLEARKQGLDKDPVVERRMKAAADKALANEYLRWTLVRAINEQTLREVYAREVAGKPGPEVVRARVIMTSSEAEARSVAAELAGGADFSDLARRRSKDPTAAAGGDLGVIRRESVSPEISAVLFSLLPGQATLAPVKAAGNWFLLRVDERRQLGTPDFDSIRPSLEAGIIHASASAAMQTVAQDVPMQEFGMTGKGSAKAGTGTAGAAHR